MTFQVALIGSDGLIVGSDRRRVDLMQSGNEGSSASIPTKTFKFARSKDDEVVCAFAGSSTARQFAQAIANLEVPVGTEDWEEAVAKIHERIESYPPREEIIVVDKHSRGQVQVVSRGMQKLRPPQGYSEWITTGDNSIPARFFPQHFWSRRPVDELRALALLTLYCAAQENPYGIGGGFDLLILRDWGIRWEPFEENSAEIADLWTAFETNTKKVIFEKVIPAPKFEVAFLLEELKVNPQRALDLLVGSPIYGPGTPQRKDYATRAEFLDALRAYYQAAR
jgi:hypothetical protein